MSTNPARAAAHTTSANASSLGTVWSSLLAPIKRFWEIPAIHLSTYYGTPNQLGRPGPVLAVWVERAALLRSRMKQRAKKQLQRKLQAPSSNVSSSMTTPSGPTSQSNSFRAGSVATSIGVPSVSDFATGHNRNDSKVRSVHRLIRRVTTGTTSVTASEDSSVPEIEGVLLVTPRAIERFQLNGLPMKRAALPETITCFVPAKIAGVGRVLICGTQKGRVYVLKASMFETLFVFDTACIDKNVLVPLQRKVLHCSRGRKANDGTYLNVAGTASVFANPPRLVAEVVIEHSSTSDSASEVKPLEHTSFSSSHPTLRADANDAASSSELSPTSRSTGGKEKTFSNLENPLLSCLSTLTGDGMTSALLEARALAVQEAYHRGMLSSSLVFKQQEDGRSNFTSHDNDSSNNCNTSTFVTPTLKTVDQLEQPCNVAPSLLFSDSQLMQALQASLACRSEICSVTVKCSFANFAEALLAGDSKGRIFAWDVPSGRLSRVHEYPDTQTRAPSCSSSQNDKERHVSALLVIHIQSTEHHLWAGYGTGLIAVYDMGSGAQVALLREPEPIRAIELATHMALVVTLSGHCRASVWNCRSYHLVKTLEIDQLTAGVPITCLKVAECERRLHGSPQAVLFLGCVDGSISIHKLGWDDPFARRHSHPSGHNDLRLADVSSAPYGAFTSAQTGFLMDCFSVNPVHSVEGVNGEPPDRLVDNIALLNPNQDGKPELCCTSLRAFIRDAAPRCPISALWVDASLDTLFIGDASGIVATLLPIRHLLGELPKHHQTTSPPAHQATHSSEPG